MGLIDRVINGLGLVRQSEVRGLSLTDYERWVELGLAVPTSSGVAVTAGSALKYSAVFACVRILAETLASLPLIVYERQEQGKQRAQDYYLYKILHDRPNEFMTSYEYRLTIQGHLALWGNAYSEIDYDGAGRLRSLFPLRPDRMLKVVRDRNNRLMYQYQLPNGSTEWLSGDRVWHLRGMGVDGFNGHNQISVMKNSIGLGLAAEEFGSRFFANDARPGMILSHPGTLNEDSAERLRKSWEKAHMGLNKSHRAAILEEGMTATEVGIPPEAAQFLETRNFQVRDIARYYRIPPHMLQDLERATFSNIEHLSIEFVVFTMQPWLKNWEQSINNNLMLEREQERYYAEFLIDNLLRGDTESRYQAYSIAIQNGIMNRNEARNLENLNPYEGGDEYLVPLNMIPVSALSDFGFGSEENGGTSNRASHRRTGDAPLQERRSAVVRRRLMLVHRPVISGTAGRVFRREANDVGNAAKKFLNKNRASHRQTGDAPLRDFILWVEKFYEDHQTWAADQMLPIIQAYNNLVADEAADEVGADLDSEATERYIRRYVQAWAARSATRSINQVEKALELAEENETEPLDELDPVFQRWRDERPEQAGFEESVRSNNAIAKFVFLAAGIISVMWAAFGENCPYCSDLNGRIVGIQQPFIAAGTDFEPEGSERPLNPGTDIGHPPAHSGCDCMLLSA